MSEVAQAAALGVALGVVTGLPLGVVNVAVAATAATAGRAPATRIGLGGAVADGIHAACAFTGLAAIVAHRPRLGAALSLGAGGLLVIAAIAALRRARAPAATAPGVPTRPFWFGLALTLPNPAALTAWLAVAAAVALSSLAAAVAAALGVALGSAAYFAGLAAVAARARPARPSRRSRGWLAPLALGAVGLMIIARGAWLLRG